MGSWAPLVVPVSRELPAANGDQEFTRDFFIVQPDDGSSAPGTPIYFRTLALARQTAKAHHLKPAGAQLVLEHIAGMINGGPAFPSYQALAEATNLSASLVRGYIAALVKGGYLTQTRQPNHHPGWDKPQWTLGPLCNVTADRHFEVPADEQSKVNVPADSHLKCLPAVTRSAHRQAPKRVSSTTTVVQPRLVAPMEGRSEEKKEERGTGGKSGEVIRRIRAAGLTPSLNGRDHKAIKDAQLTAEQIAAVYVAIATTDLGDDFMRRGLTVFFAINRWGAYEAWQRRAPSNGRVKRGVEALADL